MKAVDTKIKNLDLVAEKREHIVNAALGLFLKKGFSATTMREISHATGINLASLYDYVGSKQGILTLMYGQMMTQWRERVRGKIASAPGPAGGAEQTRMRREALRTYLSYAVSETWERYAPLVRVLYRESFLLERDVLTAVMGSESEFVDDVAARMKEVGGVGEADAERVDILANLFVYMLGLMSNRYWIMKKFDRQLVIDVTVELFLSALESFRSKPVRNGPRPVQKARRSKA
ncbi:MAG: TetR/AcrR family transcriptional regulator [bacterium]